MEKKLFILLLIVAVFFASCSTGYIGKTLPTDNLCKLSGKSNTCTLPDGTRITYHVEDKKLVGKLVFSGRPHAAGYEIISFTLVGWFADGNGLICAKSSCSWSQSDYLTLKDGLEFAIKIPEGYKDLKYVGFSYHGTTGS